MSVRNTILNTLKTELEDKVNIGNGYNCDIATVKRGDHQPSSFQLKPAVGFVCYRDNVEEHLTSVTKIRKLSIYIYGITDTDGLGNVDAIHDLADDIDNFLDSSDFTYTDDTYLDEMIIYEGGEEEKSSLLALRFDIVYRT